MLKKEYMKIVIKEFLRKNNQTVYLNVGEFVNQTGIEKKDAVKFFMENNYKEATIGTFIIR